MGRSNKTSKAIVTDKRAVLAFGKYKGETIQDVLDNDPQYLVWLHENSEHFELGWELLEEASKPPQHTFSGFSTRYDPR
mgnify:CR=1 FL=1